MITDIRYMNNEREPEQLEMRKVIYDIFCETDTGEHIIVEMQNRWQEHFRDRALFYMSKSIVQQAVKGSGWDYKLTAVYGIFFVNFMLEGDETEHFCKDVALVEKHTGRSSATSSGRSTSNCPGSTRRKPIARTSLNIGFITW